MKNKCFLEVNAFGEKHYVGGIVFHKHNSLVNAYISFSKAIGREFNIYSRACYHQT